MNKLLTPDEVAELLSVQKSTIYQWTHQGFIPHIKLGKFVRFKEKDVMEWMEKLNIIGRSTVRIDMSQVGLLHAFSLTNSIILSIIP